MAPVGTSRWRRSSLTFGPVGRIVATALLLIPVLLGIFLNVFFLIAAGIWLFLLPTALRDVWRRTHVEAPLPPRALDLGREVAPADSIAERSAPQRW